jgi:hypothetical protein
MTIRLSIKQDYFATYKEWYIRTLPDDRVPAKLRNNRPNDTQGWPQTVPLITAREMIPMTEQVQRWLYAINPGLPAGSFAAMFDTWNTGSKVRDGANFITGERLDGDLPKYPAKLTMGCNVYKVKDYVASTDLYEIYSVDVNALPDPSALPVHLMTHLTIYKGGYVNPFDYNGGRNDGRPCYTAPLSVAPLYIDAGRVEIVTDIPNPYNPEWEWK